MAGFNYLRKEIDAKIVYYGPGISGKTTNLQYIHEHLKQDQRGKMVSLATDEDRTLFFDFLPIELERVRGFKTRFHLYTVPGQVYYGATRRAVLTGADGIIFVADSQADRLEDNLQSLRDLEENLHYYRKNLETTPFVIQYNKRDLPNILSIEELNQRVNRQSVPHFEAVATSGKGVFETLTLICRLVLKGIETGAENRRPGISDSVPRATAARPLQTEKGISGAEAPRSILKVTPGKTEGLRLEKEASPGELRRPSRIPASPGEKSAEEMGQAAGRPILSRAAEKKMPEPPLSLEEERGEVSSPRQEKLRILSCGQPRISTPSSLEIPLTLEVEGLGKSLTFNLAIKLEQLDQKIN
jgi:hypothetical protein